MDLSYTAMAKDSFRQWKKVTFRYTRDTNRVLLFKKASSSKPIVTYALSKVSLSLIGKAIGFSKRKSNPVFVQFATVELAKSIYDELIPLTKDYSSEISLDNFPDATVMSNEKGVIINVNSKMLDLLGYTRDEMIGQNVTIMMDHHIGNIHDQLMDNYFKTGIRRLIGKSRLVRAKHKDGYLFPVVILLGELLENIDGNMVSRLIANITPEVDVEEFSLLTQSHQYSEGSQADESSCMFSEEDWSEDDDDGELITMQQLVAIVDNMATYIEMNGTEVEGIFRLSGNFTDTQDLWTRMFVKLEKVDFSTVNVNNLCDLLKRSLQERKIIYGDPYDDMIELAASSFRAPDFYTRLFEIFAALSQDVQMIIQRLFLLFSHILVRSSVNKMTIKSLAIVATPLLIQPETENVVEHTKLFTKLMKKLIKNSRVITKALPSTKNFSLYGGPGKLTDKNWTVLMTNSQVIDFSPGDHIVPDDGRDIKLYYLASGVVAVVKDGKTVSSAYSGEYIPEMADVDASRISTTVIAIQPCKVIKLAVPFLTGLFETNRRLFFKFFWEQARALAIRLKNLPLVMDEVDLHQTISGEEVTKLEIHLPDGGSRWMGFPLDYTVKQMGEDLQEIYPKYSKKAYLIETSHGRDLCRLQPSWTVEELLIRAKYACDYKIIYVVDDNLNKKSKDAIPVEESIIISQYPCKRKKKLGTLFILQSSVLHVSKLFGLHSKNSIPFEQIFKILQQDASLTIAQPGGKKTSFVFSSEEICTEARRLIQSLANTATLSPRTRKSSIEFDDQQWGLVLKRCKILQPALIDMKPGDLVRIHQTDVGKITGSFKGQEVIIDSENIEILPPVSNSPLMIHEELKEDIYYPNLEQLPTKNDWATLLLHGKRLQFKKGEVIVPEGSKLQRIYQIESGFCTIQATIPDSESSALAKQSKRWKSSIGNKAKNSNLPFSVLNIQTIGKGETFGELSLLTGDGSMAAVVADGGGRPDDITTVFMVEASNLSALFAESPKIGGRFAKYIHGLLKKRMQFEAANRRNDSKTHVPV